MSVSHDGHARFAHQESGQVFANGSEQKSCAVSESVGRYTNLRFTLDLRIHRVWVDNTFKCFARVEISDYNFAM